MRQFLSRVSRKVLVIGGIVLGLVLLSGIGLAAAAALHPASSQSAGPSASSAKGGGVPGRGKHLVQVTAANGDTLTVTPAFQKKSNKSNDVTLTVSSSTKIMKYGKPAQLSDIQVDEYLIVEAQDAQHVTGISILGFGERGSIQALNDGGLTIQNAQGQTVNIAVGSNTHIVEGHMQVSLSDLQPGEVIEAFGDKSSAGSLGALLIHVDLVRGQVTAISGSTITLSQGNKKTQITVTTSGATKYYVAGQPVSASTLQQGDTIGVAGQGSSKAGIAATAIFIQEPTVGGKVTAVNGNTITVQAKNGTWTITVNSSTRYLKAGKQAALSDVQVGGAIEAVGLKTGDNALTALVVRIPAAKK